MSAPRILVAEDDPLTLEALDACLTQEGFETVLAKNGKEAIERWREGGFVNGCEIQVSH